MKKLFLMMIMCLAVLIAAPMWAEPVNDFSIDFDVGVVVEAAEVAGEVAVYQPFSLYDNVFSFITAVGASADSGLELEIGNYSNVSELYKPESLAYIMNY